MKKLLKYGIIAIILITIIVLGINLYVRISTNKQIIKEKFEDYTEKELLIIKNKFIELQNSYPLGVCISKPIHVLFHQLYGSGNNTPEQWYIFSENFKKGEYDSLLRKVS